MGFDYESRNFLLLISLPLLALGIAEVVIGMEVFRFTSNKAQLGAWWAGVGAIVTYASGYFTSGVGGNALYIAAVMLCGLVCLAGTLVDGIAFAVAGKLKACANDNLEYWGYGDLQEDLYDECDLPNGSADCYCISGASSLCYHYHAGKGFDKDDCGPLTDEYGQLLKTSYSLCLAMFFGCGVLFFLGLCVCCRQSTRKRPPPLIDPNASSQCPIAPVTYMESGPPPDVQYATMYSQYEPPVATVVSATVVKAS